MTTTTTRLLRDATIELESAVPEIDGQRVSVVFEPVEEERLSAQQQCEFWQAWVERGPEGPIEDGTKPNAESVRKFQPRVGLWQPWDYASRSLPDATLKELRSRWARPAQLFQSCVRTRIPALIPRVSKQTLGWNLRTLSA